MGLELKTGSVIDTANNPSHDPVQTSPKRRKLSQPQSSGSSANTIPISSQRRRDTANGAVKQIGVNEKRTEHGRNHHDQTDSSSKSKQVAFATGTKSKDSDSTKTIRPKRTQPGASPTALVAKEKVVNAQKRAQRQNRPPSTITGAATVQVAEENPLVQDTQQALRYLDTFYNYKDNWKFNKTLQKQVLRDIFDVEKIPLQYNPAIIAYVDGLQGDAAKARLVETANEITTQPVPALPDSIEEVAPAALGPMETAQQEESPEREASKLDRQIVKDALKIDQQAGLERTREFQSKMAQRQRAATILEMLRVEVAAAAEAEMAAAAETEQTAEQTVEQMSSDLTPILHENNHAPGKRSRGRKRRIHFDVPDDEDSSSSEDSASSSAVSSGSDSESEDSDSSSSNEGEESGSESDESIAD